MVSNWYGYHFLVADRLDSVARSARRGPRSRRGVWDRLRGRRQTPDLAVRPLSEAPSVSPARSRIGRPALRLIDDVADRAADPSRDGSQAA